MATLSLSRTGRALVLCTALVLAAATPSGAAPSEQEVKAAYLFNFARYVTWPDEAFDTPSDPIRICVIDDEAFRSVLETTVAGKKVGKREVAAESRASVNAAADCHIAFLHGTRADAVAGLVRHNVFTVSDDAGFAADGGVANFVLAGSKVRFEINTEAAEKSGLQVSSRLLRLAQVVE